MFGGYVADIEVGGKALEVALWDTVGNSEYERLRPLSYPDTHVVLLCFAIDSLEAFEEVQQKVRRSFAQRILRTLLCIISSVWHYAIVGSRNRALLPWSTVCAGWMQEGSTT